MPMIKLRSIDDVPILAITLWGPRYDDFALRTLAAQLHDAIKEVGDVSEVTLLGGRRREMRVETGPRPARGLRRRSPHGGAGARRREREPDDIRSHQWRHRPARAGRRPPAYRRRRPQRRPRCRALGRPVLLRDVATVVDGDADPRTTSSSTRVTAGMHPAVTLAVAKRKGTNAIAVTHRVEQKLETLRGTLVPDDVNLTVTRNYGETSAEKSNELLWHMFLAVVSVSLLIWLVLGKREAAGRARGHPGHARADAVHVLPVRLHAEPHHAVRADLLDRHPRRRCHRRGREHREARAAPVERGMPACWTCRSARWTRSATRRSSPRSRWWPRSCPMAFVGGLMGPYMRPIPVGASAAMIFSLSSPSSSRRGRPCGC